MKGREGFFLSPRGSEDIRRQFSILITFLHFCIIVFRYFEEWSHVWMRDVDFALNWLHYNSYIKRLFNVTLRRCRSCCRDSMHIMYYDIKLSSKRGIVKSILERWCSHIVSRSTHSLWFHKHSLRVFHAFSISQHRYEYNILGISHTPYACLASRKTPSSSLWAVRATGFATELQYYCMVWYVLIFYGTAAVAPSVSVLMPRTRSNLFSLVRRV